MWQKQRRKRLENYVRRYFKKYPAIKLVVVTGSIGKTQTKVLAATLLATKLRVRLFHGNRGTNFTTPLAVLGIDYPGDIKGLLAWRKVHRAARQRIKQAQDVDVIVLELNASHLGSLVDYARYLQPDVAVVTAISESNIRVFESIDQVAREQLSIGSISRSILINRDDIDSRFAEYLTNPNMNTYGLDGSAEYKFEQSDYTTESGFSGQIMFPDAKQVIDVKIPVHDTFTLRQVVAATALASRFGMTPEDIATGVAKLRPLPGHMVLFEGREDSLIIDDTANNSPLGAKTALQALYQVQAPQKIAVLGSMRRLGQFAQAAHREIGALCDPAGLDWVITVGDEANNWLAPAARGRGCQVKECANAIEAGAFASRMLESGSAVLFNGHEDDFLEEAVKVALRSSQDYGKLVRQGKLHMEQKTDHFSAFQ